ncbi:MAG: hypothetical protein ACE5HC_01605 [Candidatus Binatia bacterium]
MRVIPELVKVVKDQNQPRTGTRPSVGTIRVDIKHQEQKTFDVVFKTEDKAFEVLIDEPAVRGGQSRGPTPLGYFVTGAGG